MNNATITNKTSSWPRIDGLKISPNDLVGISHAQCGALPVEYESCSITFEELCKAIAKKLQHDGVIPTEGD